MKKTFTLFRSALLIAIITATMTAPANAIPAFARKYQISCQVCHSPAVPRLKAFGDEFAGQGFRMTEYEAPRYFVNTGDEKLSLIREFPLGLRLDAHATYSKRNDGDGPDFGAPYGVKLLTGGELSNKLSYYMYFYMSERGEIAGVEDAFLMWHDLFGAGINLYVGQFQKSDPLFKREARLTLEDYHAYTVSPGNSRGSLKYDRGIMIEYGLPTGTDIVAQIVNGNGIEMAGEGHLFDRDKYKTWLLKINQGFGEVLSVGFFGSSGKELLPGSSGNFVNRMTYFGPDMSLNFGEKLIFNLQYVRRTDSQVYMDDHEIMLDDVKMHAGFAEIIIAPKGDRSDWYLAGLVNLVDSDIDNLDYQSVTLHAGYLLNRNVRLVTEYTHQLSGTPFGKASVGFVSAF
jgi:hypothetical protein